MNTGTDECLRRDRHLRLEYMALGWTIFGPEIMRLWDACGFATMADGCLEPWSESAFKVAVDLRALATAIEDVAWKAIHSDEEGEV